MLRCGFQTAKSSARRRIPADRRSTVFESFASLAAIWIDVADKTSTYSLDTHAERISEGLGGQQNWPVLVDTKDERRDQVDDLPKPTCPALCFREVPVELFHAFPKRRRLIL